MQTQPKMMTGRSSGLREKYLTFKPYERVSLECRVLCSQLEEAINDIAGYASKPDVKRPQGCQGIPSSAQ